MKKMEVFISYSYVDTPFVKRLAEALKKINIDVGIDQFEINVGDNLIEKIEKNIKKSDYIVVVLSKNYSKSKWSQRELAMWAMEETSRRSIILPILIEDCEIPLFLRDKKYADFRTSFDKGFEDISRVLLTERKDELIKPRHIYGRGLDLRDLSKLRGINKIDKISKKEQISKLKEEFYKGSLTFFCGAGISIEAGIPSWETLLKSLLITLFNKKTEDNILDNDSQMKLVEIYHNYFNLPSLIIAQYIKNVLGDDFLKNVRGELYKNKPTSCNTIDVIVELCRPQRERKSLNSVVTFNFDDLIEHNLEENKITYKSIYKEGQRASPTEIPIYHVHGFLPRKKKLAEANDIVFSEDAYHSQFIEPFSWSNLVQLSNLNQNTCLFVGLSMTDPNLRRLLDVSMRKNPNKDMRHYIFKKEYKYGEIYKYS